MRTSTKGFKISSLTTEFQIVWLFKIPKDYYESERDNDNPNKPFTRISTKAGKKKQN